jgi:NNP family nitrate/nitrite transporter-like MFS transporter
MFKKLKSDPKYGYVILVMLCLGIALPDFGQFQVSSLADKLRAAMDLSQSEYSTIATAPLLAGILFGFLAGVLMDRFGIRVVTASIVLTSVGLVMRVPLGSFAVLYISGILIGTAATFINTTAPKIIGAWFPREKTTQLMGVVLAVANLSMALGTGTAALFSGVSAAFRFSAVLAAAVLLIWCLFITEKRGQGAGAAEAAPIPESIRVVGKNGGVWLVSLFCIGSVAAIGSVSVFMPQALMSRGMTDVQAGWYSMAVTLGNAVTNFVSPAIIRRFGTSKKRLGCMVCLYSLGEAVFVALGWRASGLLLPLALFLSGFCAMGFLAFYQTIPLYLRGVGSRYSGTATGLIITVQLAASVVLPSYVIAPIAGDDYRLIFLLLGAIPLIPVVLSPFLPVKDMFPEKAR